MIDLTTLARARFRRGTNVHAVAPPGSRTTACGRFVHLHDLLGRPQDAALPPGTPVTCAGCKRHGAAP